VERSRDVPVSCCTRASATAPTPCANIVGFPPCNGRPARPSSLALAFAASCRQRKSTMSTKIAAARIQLVNGKLTTVVECPLSFVLKSFHGPHGPIGRRPCGLLYPSARHTSLHCESTDKAIANRVMYLSTPQIFRLCLLRTARGDGQAELMWVVDEYQDGVNANRTRKRSPVRPLLNLLVKKCLQVSCQSPHGHARVVLLNLVQQQNGFRAT